MKRQKLLFTLSMVVLLLIAVCIIPAASTEQAEGDPLNLKILGKNLSLEDSVYIYYAVPVEGNNGSDIKMLFWTEPQSEYVYGTQAYELSPEPNTMPVGDQECYVFNFDKLAAKQMTVDVYSRVYATDGNTEYYSPLDKYSVLLYCYNMLGKTSSTVPTEKMTNLLTSLLEYGAAAQDFFGENVDRLANDDYYQIKLEGTTLSDGTNHGLYLEGDEISVTAPETNDEGKSFLYWQNSAEEQVSQDSTYTIQVGEANEVYTAVYGERYFIQVIGGTLPNGSTSGYYAPGTELTISAPQTTTVTTDAGEEAVDFAFWENRTGEIVCKEANYTITVGTSDAVYTAVYDTPDSYFAFTDRGNGTYTIAAKDVNNMPSDVIIPSTYKGQAIVSIGSFQNCYGLINITIPDSILYISSSAFENCASLTNVTMGKGVKSVGNWAFAWCGNLSNVTMGNNVTNIGEAAFYSCSNLFDITIPNSVTQIGAAAFYWCENLTSVNIPNGVTNIAHSTFQGCRRLTSVTIPNSVTQIGNHAFTWCDSLTSISIPNSVTNIDSDAFSKCSDLTSITVPSGLTCINKYTFSDCNNLVSIIIPNSVTKIDEYAFQNCENLKTVYYTGEIQNWNLISLLASGNSYLISAVVYYYSEPQPATEGNYWRYVDGMPTAWE